MYRREPLAWDAGFLARKSFLLYRRRGCSGTSPLPHFYIGAHAAIGRLALLTRDAACYSNSERYKLRRVLNGVRTPQMPLTRSRNTAPSRARRRRAAGGPRTYLLHGVGRPVLTLSEVARPFG